MNTAKTIEDVRRCLVRVRAEGKTVGLVPTMGALHAGHLTLIDAAVGGCDFVVVSIFVNPTQFAPDEDFSVYPRTLEADLKPCQARGVGLVFHPSVEEMYGSSPPPAGAEGGLTEVSVSRLTDTLCGRSRPMHFTGVCTVVAKLFNIVQPDKAYFGEKDYQQAAVIRRMAADLNFPVEVVTCPIVREADGLAASSRNVRLTVEQRREAGGLYASLKLAEEIITRSHPPGRDVIGVMRTYLAEHAPLGEIDYVQIVDPHTLRDAEDTDRAVLVALAVRFGRTRLIDNIRIVTSGRLAGGGL